MTELSLFYNHAAFADTMILIGDESAEPDKIEQFDNIFVLKEGDRIIGINIFKSRQYVKIHACGLVHSLNDVLAKLITDVIYDATGYRVCLVESVFILGRVVDKRGEHYLIYLGEDRTEKALSMIEEVPLGEYVEVALKETRLPTGHKAYHYLKGRADYLITNIDLTSGECGSKLYQLK